MCWWGLSRWLSHYINVKTVCCSGNSKITFDQLRRVGHWLSVLDFYLSHKYAWKGHSTRLNKKPITITWYQGISRQCKWWKIENDNRLYLLDSQHTSPCLPSFWQDFTFIWSEAAKVILRDESHFYNLNGRMGNFNIRSVMLLIRKCLWRLKTFFIEKFYWIN